MDTPKNRMHAFDPLHTRTNIVISPISVRPIKLAIRKATHTCMHTRVYIQHHLTPLDPVACVDFIAELLEIDDHGVTIFCTSLLEYVTLTSGGRSGARIHRYESLSAQQGSAERIHNIIKHSTIHDKKNTYDMTVFFMSALLDDETNRSVCDRCSPGVGLNLHRKWAGWNLEVRKVSVVQVGAYLLHLLYTSTKPLGLYKFSSHNLITFSRSAAAAPLTMKFCMMYARTGGLTTRPFFDRMRVRELSDIVPFTLRLFFRSNLSQKKRKNYVQC